MRRKLALLLCFGLFLSGCHAVERPGGGGGIRSEARTEADRELDAQLGLLTQYITAEERAACMEIWTTLRPIRQGRMEKGQYRKGEYEQRLLRRLNTLYEEYTVRYLNPEDMDFGYEDPPYQHLAEYRIQADGSLKLREDSLDLEGSGWTEEELAALWDKITGLLPQGALAEFSRLRMFTDGEDETVAYVYAMDAKGKRWEMAIDPVDSTNEGYFVETILHEYCHYLTLNAAQVTYTGQQTVDTYNEEGMVSRAGSYIDDFYQEFWTDYLDDCLACPGDTFNFFLRHDNDFIDPYASTDPSEDICESFTFFVLRPRDPDADAAVWSQKLDFFYRYPELVEFRQTVRDNLDLAEEEYFEDRYDREEGAPAGEAQSPAA